MTTGFFRFNITLSLCVSLSSYCVYDQSATDREGVMLDPKKSGKGFGRENLILISLLILIANTVGQSLPNRRDIRSSHNGQNLQDENLSFKIHYKFIENKIQLLGPKQE